MADNWETFKTGAVLDQLEAGETPARVAEALGLTAQELIAAFIVTWLGADDSAEPLSLIQMPPKRPWLAPSLTEAGLAPLFPSASLTSRLGLSAALLQIHDFWDASHEAAQRADDLGERAVSAYWHGIAHRREPDPGNASYWFRRVGRHPSFVPLAEAAQPLLNTHGDPKLTSRLISGGAWNPMAFIDLCGEARSGSELEVLAKRLQRLEMATFLGATVGALNG